MAELEEPESGAVVAPTGRCLVGRSSTCELRLPEPVVSSEHAVIFWTGTAWEVRDLGSRNGTFVDGEQLASGQRRTIAAGARLSFGARAPIWRLVDDGPPPVLRASAGMSTVVSTEQVTLGGLGLRFEVSADEEHVQVVALVHGQERRLPARAFQYLLLTLARARLRDHATDPGAEAEHGWLYADETARGLGMDVERMNVDIFRARKQLAEQGVRDAAEIVERRPTTHQLRIGVAQLEVVSAGKRR